MVVAEFDAVVVVVVLDELQSQRAVAARSVVQLLN